MSPVRRRIVDLLVAYARAAADERAGGHLRAVPPTSPTGTARAHQDGEWDAGLGATGRLGDTGGRGGTGPGATDEAQVSDPRPDDLVQGMTAVELAGELGLHVTTTRFHLDQLVGAGILGTRAQRTARAGRPRKEYYVNPGTLEPPGQAGSAMAFQALAELLANSWPGNSAAGMTPEQAGWMWSSTRIDRSGARASSTPGQFLVNVGRTLDALVDWGYTSEIETDQGGRHVALRLTNCPFLALARDRPEVVCGVHRGLIRGALEALGETDLSVSLEPFVGPTECVAHVVRKAFDSGRRPAGDDSQGSS